MENFASLASPGTELYNDLQNFANTLRHFNIYSDELLQDFQYCLLSENSPDNYYDYLNSGAFKECYKLTNDYIIKFATEENNSDAEIEILAAAEESGIAELFLPTKMFYLTSCTLTPYYIDRYGSYYHSYYNYDYHEWRRHYYEGQSNEFTSVFIQPFACKIGCDSHSPTMPYTAKDYNEDPVINQNTGEIVPYEFIERVRITNRQWIEDIVNLYGEEMLAKLGMFIKEHGLYDLHSANIGWYADGEILRPVILDWLSD